MLQEVFDCQAFAKKRTKGAVWCGCGTEFCEPEVQKSVSLRYRSLIRHNSKREPLLSKSFFKNGNRLSFSKDKSSPSRPRPTKLLNYKVYKHTQSLSGFLYILIPVALLLKSRKLEQTCPALPSLISES